MLTIKDLLTSSHLQLPHHVPSTIPSTSPKNGRNVDDQRPSHFISLATAPMLMEFPSTIPPRTAEMLTIKDLLTSSHLQLPQKVFDSINNSAKNGRIVDDQRPSHFISLATAPSWGSCKSINNSAKNGRNVDDQRPSHFISLATAPSCSMEHDGAIPPRTAEMLTIKDLLTSSHLQLPHHVPTSWGNSAKNGRNVDDQRPSHFISLATGPSCSINNSAKNGRNVVDGTCWGSCKLTIKDLLTSSHLQLPHHVPSTELLMELLMEHDGEVASEMK